MNRSIDAMLGWYVAEQAKGITYSMDNRLGPNSYDCSSAGYFALIAGGFFPANTRIGNTDSMFNDLERNGWEKIQPDAQGNYDTKRGDAVIWGVRGASTGGFGHYMMFLDANNVIHCNSYYNGIHVNNYDALHEANDWPVATYYRYTGASYSLPSIQGSPTDQVLDKGSWIKFENAYAVDDLQNIGDIWQVRSNALCVNGFSWDDNGIPAEPLVEVDADGYATVDQDLAIGSRFKIPGKYEVLDLGLTGDEWLAQISWNGLKFWVDVKTATEVTSNDPGTQTPANRPAPPVQQPVPTPSPAPTQTTPAAPSQPTTPSQPPTPSTPTTDTPTQTKPAEPTAPQQDNKPKEDTMAISQEQQSALKVNSDKANTQYDATDLSVVSQDGKTSKKALIAALYLFIRSWALLMIPVISAGVWAGHVDWNVVEITGAGTALVGLDKFLHDNPNIPFNGITGF